MDERLYPKFYYTCKPCIVILEDITPGGYRSFEKGKLLDYEHSSVATRWLGKFHPASVTVYNKDPETVETAGENYMFTAEKGKRMGPVFMGCVYNVAKEVKTWQECKKYSAKIKKIVTIFRR